MKHLTNNHKHRSVHTQPVPKGTRNNQCICSLRVSCPTLTRKSSANTKQQVSSQWQLSDCGPLSRRPVLSPWWGSRSSLGQVRHMHYWLSWRIPSSPNDKVSLCRHVYPVTPLASTWKRAILHMEYTNSFIYFMWARFRKGTPLILSPVFPQPWEHWEERARVVWPMHLKHSLHTVNRLFPD